MKQRSRIAAQRALAREAIGKLRAISEYMGAEESADSMDLSDLTTWEVRVNLFEKWIFEDSPIA